MSFPILIDICSDEENEVVHVKEIKPNLVLDNLQGKEIKIANIPLTSGEQVARQGSSENTRSTTVNVVQRDSRITDYANSFVDEHFWNPVSISRGLSMSLCRQFWKAGDYEVKGHPKPLSRDGKNHLRVHPKFLHSNATSHKWAFGAIAELLDNALDEAHNGATFVIVDKMSISQNGSPALLIHDNGGGMDPETMRCCMSFGFSDKKSDFSIGQYGNGFKTSTMRLGADAIVFSRCMSQRTLTQSVGLLSYTFLRQTCCEDVVVPMVDYKLNPKTEIFERFIRHSEKRYLSNLSALLKWSPFASESELLKQFDDIGHRGTKIIIFNLWFTEEGDMELDFESDASDIMISGARKRMAPHSNGKPISENHIANQLRYSLREYSSVLYLHMPENFRIILRGQVVEPHQFINDLRFIECIKYKPLIDGREIECITTIGFLEGAPNLNIHGFNVYHKNRLILPFWRVVSKTNNRGRGVSGVLEANFIKPTHDKQDFEKSTLYHRLEARLKEMTLEYWDFHCHLVGYPSKKRPHSVPAQPAAPSDQLPFSRRRTDIQSVVQNGTAPDPSHLVHIVDHASFNSGISGLTSVGEAYQNLLGAHSDSLAGRQAATARTQSTVEQFLRDCHPSSQTGLQVNLRHDNDTAATESLRRQTSVGGNVAGTRSNYKTQQPGHAVGQSQDILIVMQENSNLRTECLEFEMRQRELELKLQKLRSELKEVEQVYEKLLTESKSIDELKMEKS